MCPLTTALLAGLLLVTPPTATAADLAVDPAQAAPSGIVTPPAPDTSTPVRVTAIGLRANSPRASYLIRLPMVSGGPGGTVDARINAQIRTALISELRADSLEPNLTFTDVLDPGPHEPSFASAESTAPFAWVSYTVYMSGPRLVSILARNLHYLGGAHVGYTFVGLTFDLLDGHQLNADDLFDSGANVPAVLLPPLRRAFCTFGGRRPADPTMLLPPDMDPVGALRQAMSGPSLTAVVLTSKGVRVAVSEMVIGADACGPTEVIVPYQAIKRVMLPDAYATATGASALDELPSGNFDVEAIVHPDAVSPGQPPADPYAAQDKLFGPRTLRTRGHINADCLAVVAPCYTFFSGCYRPEATAQALAIHALSSLVGADGRPRPLTGIDPISSQVDWETVVPRAFVAPDGTTTASQLRGDIFTDGRLAAPAHPDDFEIGIAEVKKWAGPNTERKVEVQLDGYVTAARAINVQLEKNRQLQANHWVITWQAPNPSVCDPLADRPTVWWAWAGAKPGHVYFAAGSPGERQSKKAEPGIAAQVVQFVQTALPFAVIGAASSYTAAVNANVASETSVETAIPEDVPEISDPPPAEIVAGPEEATGAVEGMTTKEIVIDLLELLEVA